MSTGTQGSLVWYAVSPVTSPRFNHDISSVGSRRPDSDPPAATPHHGARGTNEALERTASLLESDANRSVGRRVSDPRGITGLYSRHRTAS